MRFLRLLTCFALFITVDCKSQTIEKPGIIPQPNSISYQQGTFLITEKTRIVIENSEEGKLIATALNVFLTENFNLHLRTSTKPQKNVIQLLISKEHGGKEAYQLDVTKAGLSSVETLTMACFMVYKHLNSY